MGTMVVVPTLPTTAGTDLVSAGCHALLHAYLARVSSQGLYRVEADARLIPIDG